MAGEILSNIYHAESFMQGGRPIPVPESTLRLDSDGQAIDSSTARHGRWTTRGPLIELNWGNDANVETFCHYAPTVTRSARDHLFSYGKVLVPQSLQFPLPIEAIDDNPSESLKQHLAKAHPKCRRILSRASKDFFDIFRKNGAYLEVGVGYGNNALRIHRNLAPAELHLVDCWRVIEGASDHYTQENLDDAYASAREKFAHDPSVVLHKALSENVLPMLPRGHFDMVYVDADHTAEACYRDLLLCEPLVHESGYLCGHDYTAHPNAQDSAVARGGYGVIEAVDRFCSERGWRLEYLTIEVHDWCFPSYVLKRD